MVDVLFGFLNKRRTEDDMGAHGSGISAFHRILPALVVGAAFAGAAIPTASADVNDAATTTPIKRVIVIIGENRTFDNVFATYEPVNGGETALNLLSEGIVNPDGSPGPNYGKALQYRGSDTTTFELTPLKTPYTTLPPALVGGPSTPYVCADLGGGRETSCDTPANETAVAKLENGLPSDYLKFLLTGGTGQTAKTPDRRIAYAGRDASHLRPGPFQITSPKHPYDAYDASPVHRFFQMYQELDCAAAAATVQNPSGCAADLFPWVETSVGAGSNGKAQPANFTDETTGEGSTAMGFYNVHAGDAPYLKHLADAYTLSDNYHQPMMGGTGANHIMMGAGAPIWFSDGEGGPETPPNYGVNPADPKAPAAGNPNSVSEIENPNPQRGTNNYYVQDGYGDGPSYPDTPWITREPLSPENFGGGSYVNCADSAQPGVRAVLTYLGALPRPVRAKCFANRYYLVNNYNPGFFGDGANAFTDTNPNNATFTIPPSDVRTIGDELTEKNISWAYYGDQFNLYLTDKYQLDKADQYCNICNWAQYSTSIMTNAVERTKHLKDTTDLYAGIADGNLPAVSYVKPSAFVDGHPASSKLILFEGFVKKIVDAVQASPKLWEETAIIITFDEGGGYWDSGYIQPLDFFGDGTRVPMIVVSPYTVGGHVWHGYSDHASILKFIEANWRLAPVSATGRDALPNPLTTEGNPYIPTNSPALSDMTDMFNFKSKGKN
jgi:phospholipase C